MYPIQLYRTHFKILKGTKLYQNVGGGIILTEQSLVLQSVTRASAGDYMCLAANMEGSGTSNTVTLHVRRKFKSQFEKRLQHQVLKHSKFAISIF